MADENEPSKVLHFRNVSSDITHGDLQTLCAAFGHVDNIVFLRDKNQALVQLDSIESAGRLVAAYGSGHAEINGRRVYMRFSRHQVLQDKASGKGPVLLVSLGSPYMELRGTGLITASLVYQIFAPYGAVLKIVVLQKQTHDNRTQALVQFDSPDAAETAKDFLQGQNICVAQSLYLTIDIQFSNLPDLTIRHNSSTSMQFSPQSSTAVTARIQQQMHLAQLQYQLAQVAIGAQSVPQATPVEQLMTHLVEQGIDPTTAASLAANSIIQQQQQQQQQQQTAAQWSLAQQISGPQ